MKTKISQSLSPDEPVSYYWSRVYEAIISDVWFVDNENEEVGPLWFTGICCNFMFAYP